MYHLRTTKTASGAIAVQVVRYENRKTVVVSHLGSTHDPREMNHLKQAGFEWIEKATGQKSLFGLTEPEETSPTILIANKLKYLGIRYTFASEVFSHLFKLFSFHQLKNPLLLDLTLMRIVEPVSKLESLKLLEEMFGRTYKRGSLHQVLSTFPALKSEIEEKVVAFAGKRFNFDFNIVFYDVTTLYFETSREDEETEGQKGLRRKGFSKDNKANQPQVVIGLIVTGDGFPVAYEVFEGNTFEGKTFIPAILRFKDTYRVKTLTVVADAAMISRENIEKLVKHRLAYIVGARLGNIELDLIKQISHQLKTDTDLTKVDGLSMRLETDKGLLLCDFSLKRYRKDKREMEKQIVKAEKLLLDNRGFKRTKFIRNKRKATQTLNTALIEKTKLLLGIKGYYTNLTDEKDETIINHYHSLWHVEQAFRIAKSDLAMRPIYHFKKQTIEAHILICFMALAVSKYMELKTGKSAKKIVKLLKSITDARILNTLTGEEIIMRKEMNEEERTLWKTLTMSY